MSDVATTEPTTGLTEDVIAPLLTGAERSPNPQAARDLEAVMSDLSERLWHARWLHDLEHILWAMMQGASHIGDRLTEEESRKLLELSVKAGGWCGWLDDGVHFFTIEEWKIMSDARGPVANEAPLPPVPPAPEFTCPACMHTSAPPPGPPPSESIIRCDICQARIAYGEAMPRIVIQPHDDRRFVVVRIGDVDHKWDRKYAHQVGLNIASISGS